MDNALRLHSVKVNPIYTFGIRMRKKRLKEDNEKQVKGNKMSFNQLKEMNVFDIRQILKEHERIIVIVSSEMLILEVRELDV